MQRSERALEGRRLAQKAEVRRMGAVAGAFAVVAQERLAWDIVQILDTGDHEPLVSLAKRRATLEIVLPGPSNRNQLAYH